MIGIRDGRGSNLQVVNALIPHGMKTSDRHQESPKRTNA